MTLPLILLPRAQTVEELPSPFQQKQRRLVMPCSRDFLYNDVHVCRLECLAGLALAETC